MAEVIEINSVDELASYRMVWNSLLADTPRASFFHTFDWLDAFWRHFGQNQRLRVLVVVGAGKPIGVVPLCVLRERRRFGALRVLTYPLDEWGVWYSPIGGAQAATLTMAARHLATTRRDWDLIDLPWTDQDKTDRGRTSRALDGAGLGCEIEEHHTATAIDIEGGWEAYLSGRPSKVRHEIRRHLRRADEIAGLEYVRHRPDPLREGDGAPAWDLYEECEEVARHSWQASVDDGNTMSDDRVRPFLRDLHAAAARGGMVDVNLLRIGGQAVAFNYNYVYNGVVTGLRMGYRQDADQKNVGAMLTLLSLRDSFERGDRRFEFGEGDQPYKRRLATSVERSYRVTHSPMTSWRSQAARVGRWLRSRSASSAGKNRGSGSKEQSTPNVADAG